MKKINTILRKKSKNDIIWAFCERHDLETYDIERLMEALKPPFLNMTKKNITFIKTLANVFVGTLCVGGSFIGCCVSLNKIIG